MSFDASASSDSDGSITKYEWDLDGNGTYETNTGTTKTTTKSYAATGDLHGRSARDRRRRQDDDDDPHGHREGGHLRQPRHSARPGLLDYWRMGDTPGTTFADSKGTNPATNSGATLGVTGALTGDAERRRALQRRQQLRKRQPEPDRQPDDDRRVLAEVERVRQQRRPGDGVHPELQRQRRRLPDRSQRRLGSSAIGIGVGRARATTRTSRGRPPACGTTTRSCSTPPRRRQPRSRRTSTASR